MDKTPYPLDTLKSWDLSGGGKFTLDALEFSPGIQELLDEVELILSASEARLKDAPSESAPSESAPSESAPSESAPSEILRNKSPAVVPDVTGTARDQTFAATAIEKDVAQVEPEKPYHCYIAFPQEARRYPTLVVSQMTVSPAARSEFYHRHSPQLAFEDYGSNHPAKSKSKGASLVSNAFFYLIIIVLLVFVESRLILQDEASKPINIGGFSPMTVLSNSMRSVYPRNTFLLTRQVDANTLDIGDDITFITESDRVVTHRITGIEENHLRTRERGFTTQGTDNQREDADMVHASNIIGQVIFSSYPLGRAIHFIRNNIIVSVIVMLIATLLLHEIINYTLLAIKQRKVKKKKSGRQARDVTESEVRTHETAH
ncbi:signal peptidase I [Lactococcus petauri]|uniref:signal peptidase I n=1 Tax=Lactococcus petauri TaxID=1940789 RepID=UPI001F0557B6|nr:signal peptidase I [Lactococcus petauri]MCH1712475.1 signal peptidase I [Lactococcus petauri]